MMINSSVVTDGPRRIAFVCTDPGIPVFGSKGAAVHAQSVLQVLVDAGHDVHVITPRPGPVEENRLAGRVTLHRLPAIGRGPAAARERAAQVSDRQVTTVLDEISPELVYERYALWGRSATHWARAHRIPSILEVNSPLIEEQRIYRELADPKTATDIARAVFGAATVISCVSDGVADWVAGVSGRSDGVMTLANGVDTDRIRPAQRRVTAPIGTEFVVGFLGTLKAWHGIGTLVDAMAELNGTDDGPGDWRLLVVGDGPLRDELTERTAAAGVPAEFTGAVHPDLVGAQLQRMDLACAPYPESGDHYFSPLKVYEYLAAGLPVLASSIGQLPEILDHGRLGRLVTPGDHHALAAALAELRADSGARARLAAAARYAAVSRHTWASVVERAVTAAGRAVEAQPVGATP